MRSKPISDPQTSANDPGIAKLALVGGGLATLLFVSLAFVIIQANGPLPIDRQLSGAVAALRDPNLDQLMIDASYLCVWQVLVTGGIIASLWLLAWRQWFLLVVIWASLLGNSVVISAVKAGIARSRPDQTAALLPAHGYSFPSGHTFSSLAFYGLLGLMLILSLRSKWQRWAVAAGVITISGTVGFSRVYVGAHWPTDVLGSWLLGIGWLSIFGLFLSRLSAVRGSESAAHPAAMIWSGALMVVLWGAAIIALAVFDPTVRLSGSVGDTMGPTAQAAATMSHHPNSNRALRDAS